MGGLRSPLLFCGKGSVTVSGFQVSGFWFLGCRDSCGALWIRVYQSRHAGELAVGWKSNGDPAGEVGLGGGPIRGGGGGRFWRWDHPYLQYICTYCTEYGVQSTYLSSILGQSAIGLLFSDMTMLAGHSTKIVRQRYICCFFLVLRV